MVGVDVADLLKNFSAKIAKWRYETTAVAFKALVNLITFIENELQFVVVLFKGVKDKTGIEAVQKSFRDKYLWTFVRNAYKYALKEMEDARHWGLVCKCCSAQRHSGLAGTKQSKCGRASRRLDEARMFLIGLKEGFLKRDQTLCLADFRGEVELAKWFSFSLRGVAVDLTLKTHQYNKVPVLIVEADNPEIAKICVEQIKSVPEHRMGLQLREFKETCLHALEVRADGGEIMPVLEERIRWYKNIPLEEGPGEGFHRESNATIKRAAASRHIWVLGSVRHNQCLDRMKAYMRKDKKRGRAVIRYEWAFF